MDNLNNFETELKCKLLYDSIVIETINMSDKELESKFYQDPAPRSQKLYRKCYDYFMWLKLRRGCKLPTNHYEFLFRMLKLELVQDLVIYTIKDGIWTLHKKGDEVTEQFSSYCPYDVIRRNKDRSMYSKEAFFENFRGSYNLGELERIILLDAYETVWKLEHPNQNN